MTEQEKKEYETRKKIASTLLHANEIMEGHGFVFCLKIADALIAAEIGDVTEWKHRAKVAEKAFLILWNECKEKLGWDIDCTMWYKKQAEKQLQEVTDANKNNDTTTSS